MHYRIMIDGYTIFYRSFKVSLYSPDGRQIACHQGCTRRLWKSLSPGLAMRDITVDILHAMAITSTCVLKRCNFSAAKALRYFGTNPQIALVSTWCNAIGKTLMSLISEQERLTTPIIHYSELIMGAVASQIPSLTIVYPTVYSGADQRKHQSSASLAFVRGIQQRPVNSPHKCPVTRKMFPFHDVIMITHRYNI